MIMVFHLKFDYLLLVFGPQQPQKLDFPFERDSCADAPSFML